MGVVDEDVGVVWEWESHLRVPMVDLLRDGGPIPQHLLALAQLPAIV